MCFRKTKDCELRAKSESAEMSFETLYTMADPYLKQKQACHVFTEHYLFFHLICYTNFKDSSLQSSMKLAHLEVVSGFVALVNLMTWSPAWLFLSLALSAWP